MEIFVCILIIVCLSFFMNEVRDDDDPIWHTDSVWKDRQAKARAYQDAEEQQRRRLGDDHQRQIWIEFDMMNNC